MRKEESCDGWGERRGGGSLRPSRGLHEGLREAAAGGGGGLDDDGARLLAAADRGAREDLEDDEGDSQDEQVHDSEDEEAVVAVGHLGRDDEEDAEEDKEERLARPREVERHPHLQLGRHEDLHNHDVQSKDPACVWGGVCRNGDWAVIG